MSSETVYGGRVPPERTGTVNFNVVRGRQRARGLHSRYSRSGHENGGIGVVELDTDRVLYKQLTYLNFPIVLPNV